MNNKRFLLLALYSFICITISTPVLWAQPAMANPAQPTLTDMPDMTEEEMLKWQQEVNKEIDDFVSKMPEEEQKEFHRQVAELTQQMEKMSEEELVEFIQGAFAEVESTLPIVQPTPEEPVEEPVIVAPTPIIAQEPTEETDKALKIIDNVITRTGRFLRTSQRIPELPGKIEQWVEKDKVKEWQIDLTWTTLKGKIESLNQKVTQLKELDPVTKKHRYISHLIKKESAYNNLAQLSRNLTASEPQVEAPEHGLGKVSKDSRAAIKKVLGSFAEAIYTLELESDIDKIIAEFAPRAKQLKDEQEASRKKALEESKKPRTESPRAMVGSRSSRGGHADLPAARDNDYAYSPQYLPEMGGAYDYDMPSHETASPSKDEKSTKDGDAKKEKKEEPKAAKKSDDFKKTVEFIESALFDIGEVIVDSSQKDMAKYIQSISATDTSNRGGDASHIKAAAGSLRRAKRKLSSIPNTQEKNEIKQRMEKEQDFSDIEREIRSKNINESSPEILHELKQLADAISSLKQENFTPTPVRRAEPKAIAVPAPKQADAE